MTATAAPALSITTRIASFVASCAVTLMLVAGVGTMQLQPAAEEAVASQSTASTHA